MTTEITKFIKNSKFTTAQKTALKENRLAMMIFNILIGKKEISFTALTGFNHFEDITLKTDEIKIWELFTSFRTEKNATNCLTAVAQGKKLNDEILNNQSKVTPKGGGLKAMTYNTFISSLEAEQRETLKEAIATWYTSKRFDRRPNFFDACYLNTGELKTGDYVQFLFDMHSYYGRILSTGENGWVSVVTADGFETLRADSEPMTIKAKDLPKEEAEAINKTFEKYNSSGEDASQKALERLIKAEAKAKATAEANKLKEEKATAKAKATETAKAEQLKEFEKLNKMKLSTKEDIKKATTNLRALKIDSDKKAEFRNKLKEAREKLKTSATTETKKPTKKATATAKAEETPKATTQGKGWSKSKAPAKA